LLFYEEQCVQIKQLQLKSQFYYILRILEPCETSSFTMKKFYQ